MRLIFLMIYEFRPAIDLKSCRINQQWRICFRWKNGDAYEIEIVDYH